MHNSEASSPDPFLHGAEGLSHIVLLLHCKLPVNILESHTWSFSEAQAGNKFTVLPNLNLPALFCRVQELQVCTIPGWDHPNSECLSQSLAHSCHLFHE